MLFFFDLFSVFSIGSTASNQDWLNERWARDQELTAHLNLFAISCIDALMAIAGVPCASFGGGRRLEERVRACTASAAQADAAVESALEVLRRPVAGRKPDAAQAQVDASRCESATRGLDGGRVAFVIGLRAWPALMRTVLEESVLEVDEIPRRLPPRHWLLRYLARLALDTIPKDWGMAEPAAKLLVPIVSASSPKSRKNSSMGRDWDELPPSFTSGGLPKHAFKLTGASVLFWLRYCLCKWAPRGALHSVLQNYEQHRYALRNCISWMVALAWSVWVLHYDSCCVTCVSFIFSSTLGSLMERNMNRVIGTSMGIIIGNLPASLLLMSDHSAVTQFAYGRHGTLLYFIVMTVIFTVAEYGALASSGTLARWTYASLLFAGFSGVQMFHGLALVGHKWEGRELACFNNLMDTLVACLIVFLVDLSFEVIIGEGAWEAMQRCLEDMEEFLEQVRRDVSASPRRLGHLLP